MKIDTLDSLPEVLLHLKSLILEKTEHIHDSEARLLIHEILNEIGRIQKSLDYDCSHLN